MGDEWLYCLDVGSGDSITARLSPRTQINPGPTAGTGQPVTAQSADLEIPNEGLGLPRPELKRFLHDPVIAGLPEALQLAVEHFLSGCRSVEGKDADLRAALSDLDRATLQKLKRMIVGRHPLRKVMKGHPALARGRTKSAEVENLVTILSGTVFERPGFEAKMAEVLDRFLVFCRDRAKHRVEQSADYDALRRTLRGDAPQGWTLPSDMGRHVDQSTFDLSFLDGAGKAGGPVLFLWANERLERVPGWANRDRHELDSPGYATYSAVQKVAFKIDMDLVPELSRDIDYHAAAVEVVGRLEEATFGARRDGGLAGRVMDVAFANGLIDEKGLESFLPSLLPEEIERQLAEVLDVRKWDAFVERRAEILSDVERLGLDLPTLLDVMKSGGRTRQRVLSVLKRDQTALSREFPDLQVAGLSGEALRAHRASIEDPPGSLSTIWSAPLHPRVQSGLRRDTEQLKARTQALTGKASEAWREVEETYERSGFTMAGGRNEKAVSNYQAAKTKLPSFEGPLTASELEQRIHEINEALNEGLVLGAEFGRPDGPIGTGGQYRVEGQEVQAGQYGSRFLPGSEVAAAMSELCEWLSGAQDAVLAGEMSPIEMAARAYLGLTSIHPFRDGNGRTARLFLAQILEANGLVRPESGPQVARFSGMDASEATCADDAVRVIAEQIDRTLRTLERSAGIASPGGSSLLPES